MSGKIVDKQHVVKGVLDPSVISADITIGTSDVIGGTVGSLLFIGAGNKVQQDNSNLFFDDTNNTLGIGTTRAGAISGTNPSLRVKGTGTTSGTSSFEVQDSGSASLFFVRNDGLINFGSSGSFTNSSGQLALSTSGSGAGLLLGGDVLLYRTAADILRTPDNVQLDARVSINDAPVSTRRLYVYNSTASDVGIYCASDASNTITGQFINSGGGTNIALIVNSFNGASNTAILVSNGDIGFGTVTGSKIGTANNEKLSLWGATPIVQPTTAVAAATFTANTSGIVNDSATFDGYTIGQVVKALRNIGALA